MEILDVLIIGAGPIGLNCALEAEKKQLDYVIIEKGTIVNSLYHYPLYMRFFSTAEKLEIDEIPFITTSPKPGRQDALEYYQGISRGKNVNINLYEEVLEINKNDVFFRNYLGKFTFSKGKIINYEQYHQENLNVFKLYLKNKLVTLKNSDSTHLKKNYIVTKLFEENALPRNSSSIRFRFCRFHKTESKP